MLTQPAPLDALPMPAMPAELDHTAVITAAAKRLRAANQSLFDEWEDLHPLDFLTAPRAELEIFMMKAKSTPEADYMRGFVQAVILMRMQIAAVTGRPFH